MLYGRTYNMSYLYTI